MKLNKKGERRRLVTILALFFPPLLLAAFLSCLCFFTGFLLSRHYILIFYVYTIINDFSYFISSRFFVLRCNSCWRTNKNKHTKIIYVLHVKKYYCEHCLGMFDSRLIIKNIFILFRPKQNKIMHTALGSLNKFFIYHLPYIRNKIR
jgi:hypothetical protein